MMHTLSLKFFFATFMAAILLDATCSSVVAFTPTMGRSCSAFTTTTTTRSTHLQGWFGGNNQQDKANTKTKKTTATVKKTSNKKKTAEEDQPAVGQAISGMGKLFDRPRFDWVNNKPVDPETDSITKARMDWSNRKPKDQQ
mmetsp:Transcript_22933/g.43615  ORF Transcript_22933/g.43615 Transcript_22933/m.43615 type:complete len:141 (-) Transcript_22933:182-604(-)